MTEAVQNQCACASGCGVKEVPILFNTQMVRAILSGTKTQTRRLVKQRKGNDLGCELARWQPGDLLWVRETWAPADLRDGTRGVIYAAGRSAVIRRETRDGPDYPIYDWLVQKSEHVDRWRPSIHMPRSASRITLEVTDVRAEPLQSITEADALAEGAPRSLQGIDKISRKHGYADARSWFQQLWGQINGPGSWSSNPPVWVVSFRILKPSLFIVKYWQKDNKND